VIYAQVTFVFGRKWNFIFVCIFAYGRKLKNASLVGLYIKLFQITPYVNDFQTLNNPGSVQL